MLCLTFGVQFITRAFGLVAGTGLEPVAFGL